MVELLSVSFFFFFVAVCNISTIGLCVCVRVCDYEKDVHGMEVKLF